MKESNLQSSTENDLERDEIIRRGLLFLAFLRHSSELREVR